MHVSDLESPDLTIAGEERGAYQKILVALDGSVAATKALTRALQLARAHSACVHALGVEEHLPHYAATVGEVEEAKNEMDSFFAHVMAGARRIAAGYGIELSTEVRAGNAAQQIVTVAREGGFELIVLGAKGHSRIRDFLLGTTSDRVSHHAPCEVLLVR